MRALIGGAAATFNANAARLGIDDQGTNANGFNDPDTDPNNGNEEMLEMAFSANAGLTQMSWDFSRAANIEISGLPRRPRVPRSAGSSDPNGVEPDLSATYDALSGTLSFALPFNIAFGNNDGFLDLANAAASAGATLTLKVTDPERGRRPARDHLDLVRQQRPGPRRCGPARGAGLVVDAPPPLSRGAVEIRDIDRNGSGKGYRSCRSKPISGG
jgi:hypothetical protein